MAKKALDGVVQNVSIGMGIGYDVQHYKNIVIAPIGYDQSMTAFAPLEAMYYPKAKTGEVLC